MSNDTSSPQAPIVPNIIPETNVSTSTSLINDLVPPTIKIGKNYSRLYILVGEIE